MLPMEEKLSAYLTEGVGLFAINKILTPSVTASPCTSLAREALLRLPLEGAVSVAD